MSMFKQATRKKLKLRAVLEGPAGSGKSYTALRWAMALAGAGGKVAVIDTEHRSASKYVGESPDGIPFKFQVCELEHYAPSAYASVIREADKAGFDFLVIDSLSHAWEGVGGALDQVDRKAGSTKGGSFSAWKDVTPQHRDMVEAILGSSCHIIGTMRSKMGYDMQQNDKGKTEVVKLGLKPIQREGMEYEFDIVCDIDLDHVLKVAKTRCSLMDGKTACKPGPEFVAPVMDWLMKGAEDDSPPAVAPFAQPQPEKKGGVKLNGQPKSDPYSQQPHDPCGEETAKAIKTAAMALKMPPEKLRELCSRCGVTKLAYMPSKDAMKLLAKLEAKVSDLQVPFFLNRWPRIIHPLVSKYGSDRVNQAGLAALGYPPTWVHTHKEVLSVSVALRSK